MQLGACFAGLAIENSMLGATHGLANPLTAHYGIPHGQAVGLMLPHVIRFNAAEVGSEYRELLEADGGCDRVAGTGRRCRRAGGFCDGPGESGRLGNTPGRLWRGGGPPACIGRRGRPRSGPRRSIRGRPTLRSCWRSIARHSDRIVQIVLFSFPEIRACVRCEPAVCGRWSSPPR